MLSKVHHKRFLAIAYEEASKSLDPSTQVGALLVRVYHNINVQPRVIEKDHNRFPNNLEYTSKRLERPLKYKFIEHAERNVIYKYAKKDKSGSEETSTDGLVMVAPWAACADCARAIIQVGIIQLVTHKQAHDMSPDFWQKEIDIAMEMFDSAGVKVDFYDGKVDGPEVLHSGKKWIP